LIFQRHADIIKKALDFRLLLTHCIPPKLKG